jgi:hypothetical protein
MGEVIRPSTAAKRFEKTKSISVLPIEKDEMDLAYGMHGRYVNTRESQQIDHQWK